MGTTITAEEADDFLALDLHAAEQAIYNYVTVELGQNQFDALAALIFNIGGGAFKKSTILKRLNTGSYVGAAEAWIDPQYIFNKAGGKVLAGLTRRRQAEHDLFVKAEGTE